MKDSFNSSDKIQKMLYGTENYVSFLFSLVHTPCSKVKSNKKMIRPTNIYLKGLVITF